MEAHRPVVPPVPVFDAKSPEAQGRAALAAPFVPPALIFGLAAYLVVGLLPWLDLLDDPFLALFVLAQSSAVVSGQEAFQSITWPPGYERHVSESGCAYFLGETGRTFRPFWHEVARSAIAGRYSTIFFKKDTKKGETDLLLLPESTGGPTSVVKNQRFKRPKVDAEVVSAVYECLKLALPNAVLDEVPLLARSALKCLREIADQKPDEDWKRGFMKSMATSQDPKNDDQRRAHLSQSVCFDSFKNSMSFLVRAVTISLKQRSLQAKFRIIRNYPKELLISLMQALDIPMPFQDPREIYSVSPEGVEIKRLVYGHAMSAEERVVCFHRPITFLQYSKYVHEFPREVSIATGEVERIGRKSEDGVVPKRGKGGKGPKRRKAGTPVRLLTGAQFREFQKLIDTIKGPAEVAPAAVKAVAKEPCFI